MGLMVDGEWRDQWYDTSASGGRFVRSDSQFRNWVTPDGAPGPTGEGGFKAEAGRYHLYVSFACPWAHRTLIYRQLKGWSDMIVDLGRSLADGGERLDLRRGARRDPRPAQRRALRLRGLSTRPCPDYSRPGDGAGALGQADAARIVSNESSEIIRMFNSAFDARRRASPATTRPPHCGRRSTR